MARDWKEEITFCLRRFECGTASARRNLGRKM